MRTSARTARGSDMDMWELYITVVGKKAPQARVIFDRFHIVKHLNEAVDKTRRELVRELKGTARRNLKNTKFPLLKAKHNRSAKDKRVLREQVRANRRLYRAMLLRDDFMDLYTYKTEKAPVISRDGRQIVFGATEPSGRTRLWVRALDSLEARALPETDGALLPFWSPDGRQIGFFADGSLKKIEVSGGPSQILAPAPNGRGGAFSPDGSEILFCPSASAPLYRVSTSGGKVTQITHFAESGSDASHRLPQFLPDGRRFLFFKSVDTTAFVGSLDSGDTKRLEPIRSRAVYTPPGYLLYTKDQTLFAQRFDANKIELRGDAVPLAYGVARGVYTRDYSFSVSENGTLAYWTGSTLTSEIVWRDRTGQRLGSMPPDAYQDLNLSPDETTVATITADGEAAQFDIWLYDIDREVSSRLTNDPFGKLGVQWSPLPRLRLKSAFPGLPSQVGFWCSRLSRREGSIGLSNRRNRSTRWPFFRSRTEALIPTPSISATGSPRPSSAVSHSSLTSE